MAVAVMGAPAQGDARPRAHGKFIYVGGRKLLVRGVTYGTFRPGRFGEPFPEPATVASDFDAMVRAGFNAVRTYTVPPEWLLDQAAEAGLRLLVGIPWEQHVSFLDEPGLGRTIQARIRDGVLRCRGHQAVLAYAVGNEVPAPIVRWSGRRRVERHIHMLFEAAKEVDPEALVTYANYPSTEYLDLPFLDFLSFNVYLESTPRLSAYLARLQNLAADRPLLVAELGLDSRRNGLSEQARILSSHLRAVETAGCAGSFAFAWTDEWHRGGRDVEDWEFGLTRRDRSPKPALHAVSRTFAEPDPLEGVDWPRISVVVCAYDAADTLDACLRGIARLDYPDFEVIVVDDGSSDDTASIAVRHPVRLIRTRNRGLSRARNTGIQEARGDIVAFIDADAWPDPDWLTHLARTFESSDVVGVGGPNIPPPGQDMVGACVANAPGGPIHVLRTDREAEHIPGCNMAFRRSALLELGGFDPRFRVAGDDVDLCWRIEARGWRIGFNPGAVVWHQPRGTVRGYWRQQCGYGAAEALLEAKWPEKYNVVGHVTWGGRVYGQGPLVLPFKRARVYGGTWGQAPFQHREDPGPSLLWQAAAMPEWYLVLAVLAVLSVIGLSWPPLLAAAPLLVVGAGTTVVRAWVGASRARFQRPFPDARDEIRHRRLTALLHLMQPLARLKGRWLRGLVPWRARARTTRFLWPRAMRLRFWRDDGVALPRLLAQVERTLTDWGCVVRRDDGWDRWDLEVEGGAMGAVRLRSCAEWHEQGQQVLRFALEPRLRGVTWALVVLGGGLGLWGLADGATGVAVLLGGTALVGAVRAIWETGTAAAALSAAVHGAVDDVLADPAEADARPSGEEPTPAAPVQRRTWLQAAG